MRDEQASRRAQARRSWTARVYRAGDTIPDDDLTLTTTPAERIGMMWDLVEQTWAMADRAIPSYSREEMPTRVLRPDRR